VLPWQPADGIAPRVLTRVAGLPELRRYRDVSGKPFGIVVGDPAAPGERALLGALDAFRTVPALAWAVVRVRESRIPSPTWRSVCKTARDASVWTRFSSTTCTLAVFTRLEFGTCGFGAAASDNALLEDLLAWLRAPEMWLARQGLRADQPAAHRLYREHGLASPVALAARATGTIDTVALFSIRGMVGGRRESESFE